MERNKTRTTERAQKERKSWDKAEVENDPNN